MRTSEVLIRLVTELSSAVTELAERNMVLSSENSSMRSRYKDHDVIVQRRNDLETMVGKANARIAELEQALKDKGV